MKIPIKLNWVETPSPEKIVLSLLVPKELPRNMRKMGQAGTMSLNTKATDI
jgi:hypothetical protein